jgi:type 1 fimbria pilin
MKLKTLSIVVAILAVLSAITFYVQRPAPPPSADARVGQQLADAATLEKAVKVRLGDQGKSLLLVKEADGAWHVPEYYDFPADFTKLAHLVGELTDARLQRLVTSNPERISRLEFNDSRIAFLDGADKELWSVTLGRNADSGGRFVRFGTEQKAYLASYNGFLEVDPKSWADAQLLNLKTDDIAKVEISFPDAKAPAVSATRAKKEEPFAADQAPESKKLKADAVTSVLNSLATLRFSDTSDPTDPNAVAARAHARTVKVTLFDGKTVTLALGRKPEEKIIKPAAAAPADTGKSGPTAVLNALQGEKDKAEAPAAGDAAKSDDGPAKTLEAATETVPAGPVFAFITDSDAKAPINALMAKRAFQVPEYTLTSLPQSPDDLFEAAAPAAPAATPTAK